MDMDGPGYGLVVDGLDGPGRFPCIDVMEGCYLNMFLHGHACVSAFIKLWCPVLEQESRFPDISGLLDASSFFCDQATEHSKLIRYTSCAISVDVPAET